MKNSDLVREYQCSGCVDGPETCGGRNNIDGCESHRAGTFTSGIGRIFLGFPKGFNRAGVLSDISNGVFRPSVFDSFEDFMEFMGIDMFNIPVWKHLDENGNTLIRGLSPRVNKPYLCVIRGNHLDKINCLEITDDDINDMD